MGITGLIPFLEKASKRVNVSEFSGCTVAIDSYCWLHKGAFACAEKLVRGEDTDVYIKYCMKYVTMLLSKNIKPILVFDGRHLPAKALTETKRRESRDVSKKRAAELLSLGKIEEARSYMRRSVDITHSMALALIKECRKRNVDCIVAPYEADAQLAYLNLKNIAHLVITEDSDLILFGCTKVLFKMDLDGVGTLVETIKLPLVMKCPIEHYTFDKFRRMCIMSGCDYLASLPGIGLAKARQFVCSTQDPNFANALRKLPSFFNRSTLTVTDEYRENFLKAEATFKHQYVYDPIERQMVRLTEIHDEELEEVLCVNAGELLDPKVAFQLALGNLDPFTLRKMDDWHPDHRNLKDPTKTGSWTEKPSTHPSIWSKEFIQHLNDTNPWIKKGKETSVLQAIQTRPRQVVKLMAKCVPETQDVSLSIETLTNMYSFEPANKKQKMNRDNKESTQETRKNDEIIEEINQNNDKSPILENKDRSFKKLLKNSSYSVLKKLSRFPRTTLDHDNIVESRFFSPTSNMDSDLDKNISKESILVEELPKKPSKNPFKVKSPEINKTFNSDVTEVLDNSQKENSPKKSISPVLKVRHIPFRRLDSIESMNEELIEENTYPLETLVTPIDSQSSFGASSQTSPTFTTSSQPLQSFVRTKPSSNTNGYKKPTCKVPGLKRTMSLPSNQPTLLSKFGFHKKPALKR